MAQVLETSSNVMLLETIESILCTTTSDPEFGADGIANYTQAKLLEELGFSAVMGGGLNEVPKETRARASSQAAEIAGSALIVWKNSTPKR